MQGACGARPVVGPSSLGDSTMLRPTRRLEPWGAGRPGTKNSMVVFMCPLRSLRCLHFRRTLRRGVARNISAGCARRRLCRSGCASKSCSRCRGSMRRSRRWPSSPCNRRPDGAREAGHFGGAAGGGVDAHLGTAQPRTQVRGRDAKNFATRPGSAGRSITAVVAVKGPRRQGNSRSQARMEGSVTSPPPSPRLPFVQ
jgi:hypothetical protein